MVTNMDSIMVSGDVFVSLIRTMNELFPLQDSPTMAIYCVLLSVRSSLNLVMSLVRGNIIKKDYLLLL